MFIGCDIGNFGNKMGEVVKAIQFPVRQTLAAHFEFEIGHDGDQVGIATALANSINGSLDLDRALPNGRQRVDDRALGVVVGVDSERVRESRLEPVEDALQIPWQGPAVGVAQNNRLRAAPDGRLQRFQRIRRIGFVAVKEMLGIIDDPFAVCLEIRHGLLDDPEIIFERGLQNLPDMQRPCLAKNGTDRCMRIDQGLDIGVIFGAAFDAAGGAERRDQRVLPLRVAGTLEELDILWVRAGPAAFDEGHPQVIQALCYPDFVIARKREALRLGSVA